MAYEVNGVTIETDANGYLADPNAWNEEVAKLIAQDEGIELTDKHWDIINYLRDEYFNNSQNQPNERTILKEMGKKWDTKLASKDTFALFPKMPSKQGAKIAGLPESRRKGGY
jgi:TusE/DsrC/DsvC family sulfur relay protein